MSSAAAASGADSNVGLDDAVKQLRAALERDPSGYATDEVTKSILEQLNKEVSRLYAEGDGDNDEDDEEEYDDEDEYDEDEEEDYDEEEEGSQAGSQYTGPRVQLPKGPRPYDLWKASHQIDRPHKDKVVLSGNEWAGLVSRLNESAKRKQMFLLQAQHRQIKDELEGLTFMPQITEKSREMASNLKSLPDRVAALMRKRRAKLDAIRHEKAQAELKEATFKPKINTTKPRVPAKVGDRQDDAETGSTSRSRVGHLMQYEMDRRIRQTQRRQLIEEMEEKELTFTPAINKNSIRIVERLTKERETQPTLPQEEPMLARSTTGTPISPTSSRAATKRALVAAMAATAASSGQGGLALPHGIGRSYLPGHEEETFHPRINARSAAIQRGTNPEDRDVYNRLYVQRTASAIAGMSSSAKRPGSAPAFRGGESSSSVAGATLGSVAENGTGGVATGGFRDANGFPVDENGEPVPGHPLFFNIVAYEPGKLDFLLRGMLAPASATA